MPALPAAFEQRVREMAILTELGEPLAALTPAEAARLEPALQGARERIAGAIHAKRDESGDCSKFSKGLAKLCAERGARLEFGTEIRAIVGAGDRVEKVVTDKGERTADAYVLALGCASARFARTLGFRLPIYPIKGYSATLPVDGRNAAPQMGGVDEERLCAFTRMGDRLRITATAEFAGWSAAHRPEDFRAMLAAARDLFPEAADWSRPTYWAGLRPMTPDNAPFLGRAPQRNLWLNTGHGHIGWTMANGSARVTADLIAGRAPAIDLAGLTLR
jgi:D-amino-acid dehydrogenase